MFTLYVVATPIGNLEDISLRALRILRTAKLIAAEDTRKTRRLLNAYDIKTPCTSYHEHNKVSKAPYLVRFLAETGDIALVSDAGTPGISDPGHELIVAAAGAGVPIVPVPGASVVMTALAVSGLSTERFTFLGFLPRQSGARRRLLSAISRDPGTLVVFEAPHRVQETLQDMLSWLGDRRLAVCREITKIHEEVFRGTISEALARFTAPRGEFTLVVEGATALDTPAPAADIARRVAELKNAGLTAKDAIASLGIETGLARKDLYRYWLEAGTKKTGRDRTATGGDQ